VYEAFSFGDAKAFRVDKLWTAAPQHPISAWTGSIYPASDERDADI